jgi:uncharacterized membrane protein
MAAARQCRRNFGVAIVHRRREIAAMATLLAGLILFLGVHLIPTRPALREALRGRFGAGGYQGLFSLLSLAGLVLIVMGYGEVRGLARANPQLYVPPAWGRHVAMLLMALSFVLLAAAYIPSRIRDRAQHPMLAAIKLWAFSHLLVRGDLASALLFGAFLAWAVYDRISVKHRNAPGPLGTVRGTARGDVLAVAAGLGAYALTLIWAHGALFGVAPARFSFSP